MAVNWFEGGREMRHRVRNTLSIVQALSQQTARSDPANFQSAFAKRLGALADAHDVLLRGSGETCDLAAIVEKTCSVFHHDGNFIFEGPRCHLPADSCVPLSLALHELCTNAVKHGALSVPTGRVHVAWSAPVDGSTTLIWEEGGGPEVRPPARKGLGTALLLSQSEIGKADLQFHPRGLRCELKLQVKDNDEGTLASILPHQARYRLDPGCSAHGARRPAPVLPCVAVALGRAGVSPAVHPAPSLPSHGWGLALRSRTGPRQATRGRRQPGWLRFHGIDRDFFHFPGPRFGRSQR